MEFMAHSPFWIGLLTVLGTAVSIYGLVRGYSDALAEMRRLQGAASTIRRAGQAMAAKVEASGYDSDVSNAERDKVLQVAAEQGVVDLPLSTLEASISAQALVAERAVQSVKSDLRWVIAGLVLLGAAGVWSTF